MKPSDPMCVVCKKPARDPLKISIDGDAPIRPSCLGCVADLRTAGRTVVVLEGPR